ncbi:hypothetical protein, partial [Nocardia farcinica]|uniref:hypothetical protein n=1 Tax=Nocardia farcinica TaxID=37329 RepID=UPI002453E0C8
MRVDVEALRPRGPVEHAPGVSGELADQPLPAQRAPGAADPAGHRRLGHGHDGEGHRVDHRFVHHADHAGQFGHEGAGVGSDPVLEAADAVHVVGIAVGRTATEEFVEARVLVDPVDDHRDGAVQDLVDRTGGDVQGGGQRRGEPVGDGRPGPPVQLLTAGELAVDDRFREIGAFGDPLHGHLGAGWGLLEQFDQRFDDALAAALVVWLPARPPAAGRGIRGVEGGHTPSLEGACPSRPAPGRDPPSSTHLRLKHNSAPTRHIKTARKTSRGVKKI